MSIALIKKIRHMVSKCTALAIGTCALVVSQVASAVNYDFAPDIEGQGGDGVKGVASNAEELFLLGFNLVKAFAVLVGLIFVFMGISRIKKSQDPNSGVSPMSGIVLLIVGGLMAVLPWVLLVMGKTFTG